MRMRIVRVVVVAAAAVAAAALTTTPAVGDEPNLSINVTNVVAKVNRAGAISVSGTMNCAAAVAKAAALPAGDYNVMASVTWTASQSIGRKSRVTASWTGGGHADACYRSWDPTAWLPWNTSYYNSTSTEYYVAPTNGKFVKGPVLIDVTVTSFYDEQGNPVPNVYQADPATGNVTGPTGYVVEVFGVTQFTVRAR